MTKDIIKEYGDVLHDPSYITDIELAVIPVSPKIDIALGGGVPEGSLFIMTGPEKVGKTVTALTFCANAQSINRKVYYGNIEGRLRKRDLEGIVDLDMDPASLEIIGSTQGNILCAEQYLGIFDNLIHTQPDCICVVDSFSALSSESELTGDLTDTQVMSVQKVFGQVLQENIKRVTYQQGNGGGNNSPDGQYVYIRQGKDKGRKIWECPQVPS